MRRHSLGSQLHRGEAAPGSAVLAMRAVGAHPTTLPRLPPPQACGSLLVAPSMQFHEWWSRGLVPGQHYVRVTHEEDHVCEQARPAAHLHAPACLPAAACA